MKLDRELQKEILEELQENYPDGISIDNLFINVSKNDFFDSNLIYLEEHELIENIAQVRLIPNQPKITTQKTRGFKFKITAKGLDFLAADGGLSAILGVVTIKIHDDTLRKLIELKILSSDLSEPDKKKWTDALRELPAESIKHLVMKLLDAGLTYAPAVIPLIGKTLFS